MSKQKRMTFLKELEGIFFKPQCITYLPQWEEGLLMDHSLGLQSPWWGGHGDKNVKHQQSGSREIVTCWYPDHSLLYFWSGMVVFGAGLPTFKVGLPSCVKAVGDALECL